MNFRAQLIKQFAEAETTRICNKVIRTLQQIKNSKLSGEDSGLESTWDEICVQVQDEPSFHWNLYEDLVSQLIEAEVKTLPDYVERAIWLQTEAGWDWAYDQDHPDDDSPSESIDDAPIFMNDIVDYISGSVFSQADSWSNAKIRAYLGE